ncbi:MAG: hypothetical protein QOC73_2082 [Actinomycetota bacterium]|jgi:hypothetical protein|nr:hypothetical protein [Actinomycetota bacterium]
MTPEERARFYAERDARTIAYGSTDAALERPVMLVVGEAAASRPGQVALLALANMVARTQRHLHVCLPDVPLRAHALLAGGTLAEAVADTVMAINPAMDLSIEVDREIVFRVPPDIALECVPQRAITIGIGADMSGGFDVYLGWKGGRAELATEPGITSGTSADVLGAATAACLGAAAVFHLSHDRPVTPVQLNLAERTAIPMISFTELSTRAGTTSIEGPLDVGNLVLVGAGALTHALAYWLAEIGVIGRRRVIDRDVAELHNTAASGSSWTLDRRH